MQKIQKLNYSSSVNLKANIGSNYKFIDREKEMQIDEMLQLVKNKKQLNLSKTSQKVYPRIKTVTDVKFDRKMDLFNEAMGDMITNMG